ncbi:MAG: TolB family protein, partial [Candidatus Krumholzibacteriia bacterium]
MLRRALHVGLFALFRPNLALAQGRQTKVYYDDSFRFGSQALESACTRYFEILTTPADEDSTAGMFHYWGPKLDDFHERVCENLQLTHAEIYKYLLYPAFFTQLEKLVLEGRLHPAHFDSIMRLTIAVVEEGVPVPDLPLALARASDAPESAPPPPVSAPRTRCWKDRHVAVSGDTVFTWLPDESLRSFQRCVLYRTLHDFLATPIGPALPEGVLGFVPRHDPNLPIVIYASLGEHRLRRTAQHEIAHAIVESIAKYLRGLATTRIRHARQDSTRQKKTWRPSSGGFSAITHENFAEYLAFPYGEMEPALRAALIEMVAENRIDGLAAISVGARTLASSYIEGPARLFFLAEEFGRDVPKRLLVGYYTNSGGFLDLLEEVTGYSVATLDRLYRRWLRERLWSEYLVTNVPDTLGSVMAHGLSGVRRDGLTLVQRVRDGRQEVVLIAPADGRHRPHERVIVRDLDGIERVPLFSSSDLRAGRVVTSIRQRNEESLLLWDPENGRRIRGLTELGAVREVRDPRWSPSARAVVFRVVDRSGRNAIAYLDVDRDVARLLTPYRWAETAYPTFAENDSLILFTSTATPDFTADVFVLDMASRTTRNITCSPEVDELEPVLVNGHLICFSDASGVPVPVELMPDGSERQLTALPFPVSRLQRSDSTLTLVATSLRHRRLPAGRAVWGFPLRALGLEEPEPDGSPVAALAAGAGCAPAASTTQPVLSAAESTPDEVATHGMLADVRRSPTGGESLGLVVSPYSQRWQFLPLGLNFAGSSTRAR